MKLRTYKGPDLASALAKARQELGPHALVLATNEIRGRLGLTSVEITVGLDQPVGEKTERELRRIAGEVERMQEILHSPAPAIDLPRSPAGMSAADSAEHPAVRKTVAALVRSGLNPDLAQRFARTASCGLSPAADAARIGEATARGVADLLEFRTAPLSAGVLFVVGPPGSGKTTTVAKLAARRAFLTGQDVTFAEADTSRVGSLEQARIYSRHMGVTFAPVSRPEDLTRITDRVGYKGAVLVDTAGVGAGDGERLEALADLRRGVPRAEVAILLPNGLHTDEARRMIDRFAALDPTCVAFSKIDDGNRPGDLVNALAETDIPLAFVTNGHRVPDDLEDATPRGLAAAMLRSADDGGRGREMHR